MLAAYGSGILLSESLSYSDWVGLWLNLDRVHKRHAVSVAEGTVAGQSSRGLEVQWADALAMVEEVVEYLHYEINAGRATARARARLGMGEG